MSTGSCKFRVRAHSRGFFARAEFVINPYCAVGSNMAGSFEVLLSSLLSTESTIRVQAEVKLELEDSS